MTEGKELTWRGVALGMSLTFIFTAANMYLGLKVGLTIATSIPAAVISMAFLGFFPAPTSARTISSRRSARRRAPWPRSSSSCPAW